jgi:regulator of sirC expression with transglutaminase-like and TPR domain
MSDPDNNAARSAFARLSGLPDEHIDIIEGALLIASETDGKVNVAKYQSHLDGLASKFMGQFDPDTSVGVSVNSVINFIHNEEGFSGNVKAYYDPENSYLNRVLDTRRGIPITLALVHVGLGKRLDIPVGGINFPGHFLVRYGIEHKVIIDPFSGRTLSEADCTNLLGQIAGKPTKVQPQHLEFASNKAILIRILDNLKKIFWEKRAWKESRACIERQLLLYPGDQGLLVQLGAVYEMQGQTQLAMSTYTTVLQNTDDPQLRDVASKRLLAVEPRSRNLH